MDNTREGDLKKLHGVFSDPLLPMGQRQRAHKSFQKIQAQMNDRILNDLRHRLARADVAGDADAVERITLQIEEYSRKKGY